MAVTTVVSGSGRRCGQCGRDVVAMWHVGEAEPFLLECRYCGWNSTVGRILSQEECVQELCDATRDVLRRFHGSDGPEVVYPLLAPLRPSDELRRKADEMDARDAALARIRTALNRVESIKPE